MPWPQRPFEENDLHDLYAGWGGPAFTLLLHADPVGIPNSGITQMKLRATLQLRMNSALSEAYKIIQNFTEPEERLVELVHQDGACQADARSWLQRGSTMKSPAVIDSSGAVSKQSSGILTPRIVVD